MSHTDRLIQYILGLTDEQCDKVIARLPEIMRIMKQEVEYGEVN